MADLPFNMMPNERILLHSTSVCSGGTLSAYTDELYLTNYSVILIRKGMFGNVKEAKRYDISDISQVIVAKGRNGFRQLELFVGGEMIPFSFQSRPTKELRIWPLAINNLLSGEGDQYDYEYYQKLYSMSFDKNYSPSGYDSTQNQNNGTNYNAAFMNDVAKNVVRSGNFSMRGIMKGVEKASKKQAKKSFFSELGAAIGEEMGINELKDEFIEMENQVREEFGMKPRKTYAEMEDEQFRAAVERENNRMNNPSEYSEPEMNQQSTSVDNSIINMTYDQKIETVKKLKDLMDSGIISQEEFDQKKKQLLGL